MILRRSRKLCLYINTKDQKQVTVSLRQAQGKLLKKDGKVVKSLSSENKYGSQVLLPLIEKLMNRMHTPGVVIQNHTRSGNLQQNSTPGVNVTLSISRHTGSVCWDVLEGIEVETGPGSFTGLRVGVSVANALGYSLGIPVNGKKIETELRY